ncbi:MAG: hypothetical protein JSV79_11905 [Armatimonadota bacterium]|nr:MAG: hypothetical protein JSV79_11905 [Armatimonadota bacterium]
MANDSGRILVVSDSPDYYSTKDLRILYPGLVDEHDLNKAPISPQILTPYERVWTLLRRAENVRLLDYSVIREHARGRGARVVSHLFEYGDGSGLEFRFRNAGPRRHKLHVVSESDPITRGFAVGDEVYWYRNSSDIDEAPVGHYAYREVICEDDPAAGRKVLARSTMTDGAMWIEERFESGGLILAYDLFSPLDLALTQGDPWILHRGTFSKYIPAGNVFGGTVRYGRYENRKLSPEEVLGRIGALADLPGRAAQVEIREEGLSSEGTPVLSVRFGNESGPRFQLFSAKHGMEWENVYGMLITLEELLKGDVIDLERFCVVAVPLLNPFGYRNGCRHNANGVDLNRQLRRDWDRFRGWSDEVLEPWTFDFKGRGRASEPESQIEARLGEEPNKLCVIDAHEMAGAPILGGAGPNQEVLRGLSEQVVANLKNRYLIRYLTDATPRQLTLECYPGKCGADDPGTAPCYAIWYENVGQLPDVHATVMQTDLAAEINLTAMRSIAESL